MINKQDIIRFVVGCKLEPMVSALVIVTDDKRVSTYVEGNNTTLAAALVLVARKNPDFKEVLVAAVANLGEEGGENG
jgi:hypothetical protein